MQYLTKVAARAAARSWFCLNGRPSGKPGGRAAPVDLGRRDIFDCCWWTLSKNHIIVQVRARGWARVYPFFACFIVQLLLFWRLKLVPTIARKKEKFLLNTKTLSLCWLCTYTFVEHRHILELLSPFNRSCPSDGWYVRRFVRTI